MESIYILQLLLIITAVLYKIDIYYHWESLSMITNLEPVTIPMILKITTERGQLTKRFSLHNWLRCIPTLTMHDARLLDIGSMYAWDSQAITHDYAIYLLTWTGTFALLLRYCMSFQRER